MNVIKFKTLKDALEQGYKIYTFEYVKSLKEWFFGLKKKTEDDSMSYVRIWTKSFPHYISTEHIIMN